MLLGVFGASRGVLETSWDWHVFGSFGGSLARLGAFWGVFGALLDVLGRLGAVVPPFWRLMGASKGRLEAFRVS